MTWENCPYYDAIGIGLKIAERSKLGKRVMTFASQPSWINLEGRNTLTDMVEEVTRHHAGTRGEARDSVSGPPGVLAPRRDVLTPLSNRPSVPDPQTPPV